MRIERLTETEYGRLNTAFESSLPRVGVGEVALAIVNERCDALAAKVAAVERLLEHGAVQHVECGNHWVAATQLRAALEANDTGVTPTPESGSDRNLAPLSTTPADGDTP